MARTLKKPVAGPAPADTAVDAIVARLIETGDEVERKRLLGPRELWTPSLVDRLADESAKRLRVDLPEAERAALAAEVVASGLGDDAARSRSLRALGHVHAVRRRYRDALDCYGRARELCLRTGRGLDAAITMSGALQTLIYVGDYARAHAWAAEARRILVSLGDELRLARLESNLGNVFFRQDRFEEALRHYERARDTFDRLGATEDAAVALRNLLVCRISLGDFPGAIAAYRRARRYCVRHGMTLMVVKADYNIAYLAFLRGEYTRAMEAYGEVGGGHERQAIRTMSLSAIWIWPSCISRSTSTTMPFAPPRARAISSTPWPCPTSEARRWLSWRWH